MDPPPEHTPQEQPRRAPGPGRVHFKYKTPTRIIACIDIVLIVLEIIAAIIFAFVLVFAPQHIDMKDLDLPVKDIGIFVSIFAALHLIWSSFKMWVSIRLYKATASNIVIQQAIADASFYRIFRGVLVVVNVIFYFSAGWLDGWFLFWTAVRILFILVVHLYVGELEEVAATGGTL